MKFNTKVPQSSEHWLFGNEFDILHSSMPANRKTIVSEAQLVQLKNIRAQYKVPLRSGTPSL